MVWASFKNHIFLKMLSTRSSGKLTACTILLPLSLIAYSNVKAICRDWFPSFLNAQPYGAAVLAPSVWRTFVTGVKVGLPVSLQMTGDVGCAEHLSADTTGDFAFMSNHVGTESVFGGESRGTGLVSHSRWGKRSVQWNHDIKNDLKKQNKLQSSHFSHRYLTFKRSFWGMHMLHMAAQVVWPR